MQALLKKTDCRLLNYSTAVKNDANFQFLLPLLEKDRKIMPDEKSLSSKQLDILKMQKEELIKVCTNEWEAISNIPKINNEKKIKCSLCGRPDLVELFDIKNMYTGQVITIGGTCINNFSALKKANRLVNNAEELTRYNELLKSIPNIREIYYQGDFINSTKYILPQNYIDEFKTTEKKLKTYVRKYVKFGSNKANGYLEANDLEEQLKTFSSLREKINTFPENENGELIFLPRSLAIKIENEQPNAKEIISATQRNNGIISPKIAQNIETINFLKNYINQLNNKLTPKAFVDSVDQGVFIISITYNKKPILMSISSKVCISDIIYNNERTFDFKLFFTKNSDKFTLYNYESEKILRDVANDVLIKHFQYRTYYPNPNEIVNSIKSYSNQVYNSSKKEIQQTLNQLVNNGYMFANDEETFIRRTVKEINQMNSKSLYYNKTRKIMQTFSPIDIAREDWKVLKLKPTQLTKEESEKLLKKVNKVLSEVNLYKGLNTDNILDITTNDLIYIAKYNLFFDNTKIAEKKIHHYETKSMSIKKYLAHIISAIMSK